MLWQNMTSMLYSFNYYKNCEDLIYYVEDDYIHKTDALEKCYLLMKNFHQFFKRRFFIVH